jgi:Fur family peroxide stress response transcriptional regulator
MNQHRVEEGMAVLKSQGLRITHQRLVIMKYLANSDSHLTAEEIYKALSKKIPNMSNATVYNNLKCLNKYGLIHELPYGQASSRFEWVTEPHYHVICTQCGKIHDFKYPRLKELEDIAKHRSNFDISGHLFEIYGMCLNCKNLKVVKQSENGS